LMILVPVVQDPRSENPSAEFRILVVGYGFPRNRAKMERGMLRSRISSGF
jgi:hypothetical protein